MIIMKMSVLLASMLLTLAWVDSVQSEESVTRLKPQIVAISQIEEGKIDQVRMFSPTSTRPGHAGPETRPVTEVTLKFPLHSCVNSLGPVAYQVSAVEGRQVVTVSAIEFRHKSEPVVRCFAPSFGSAKIYLPPFIQAEDIELNLISATAQL